MFADLFVLLFASHLTADYPGQTDHQAAHKADPGRAGWTANLVHAATHVLISAAVLLLVGRLALGIRPSALGMAAALAWIGISHAFIDRRWAVRWWMENAGQRDFLAHGGAAHVDQAAHIALGLVPAAVMLAVL